MQNITDAGPLADYPPQVVLQAVLATKLTSFTEFAFGVCAARHSQKTCADAITSENIRYRK